MKPSSATFWTIHELTAQIERELAVDYEGAISGRVRDIPDTRTIRYYTTLGLLDRPAEMRGRTALYAGGICSSSWPSRSLQAEGLSLTQVQERMAGATDRLLESLAGLRANSQPKGETLRPRAVRKRLQRVVLENAPAASSCFTDFPRPPRESRGSHSGPIARSPQVLLKR